MASIVHNPGRMAHLTSDRLHLHLAALPEGEVISDREAQTIAAFWHTSGNPNSTLLSTMGKVSSDMSIEDFGRIDAYRDYDPNRCCDECAEFMAENLAELEALDKYIKYYQQYPTTPTGTHLCACYDCFDVQYSRKGDLCEACEEAGCSGDQGDECERDDAYGAEDYSEDACND